MKPRRWDVGTQQHTKQIHFDRQPRLCPPLRSRKIQSQGPRTNAGPRRPDCAISARQAAVARAVSPFSAEAVTSRRAMLARRRGRSKGWSAAARAAADRPSADPVAVEASADAPREAAWAEGEARWDPDGSAGTAVPQLWALGSAGEAGSALDWAPAVGQAPGPEAAASIVTRAAARRRRRTIRRRDARACHSPGVSDC